MNRVFILKGGPGTGKSTLMKKVGEHFTEQNMEVEHIYCSSDPNSLDGVIIKDIETAIVDGTAPHVIEPTAPGAIEEYVSLGVAWCGKKLKEKQEAILHMNEEIASLYRRLYGYLRDAKSYHTDLERIYIKNTDFEKVDQITDDLIEEIFKDVRNRDREPRFVHRFFGALTDNGAVNHIENLTENLETRYFIKGRPGTGKSSLLKKIASQANLLGLDVEVYHCSLDSESIDMVILPELKIGIFDATAPHELFPTRETDVILDIYEAAVNPDTEHENISEICQIKSKYNELINQASALLGEIHQIHDDLEKIYIDAVDFSMIDKITRSLIEEME